MGAFFSKGESKTRAGVYRRYENIGLNPVVGADDGTLAVVLTSNWGPLEEARVVDSLEMAKMLYGDGTSVKDVLLKAFELGVEKCVVARTGSGGTKATLNLNDTTSVSVIKLDTKYETNRAFKISIRQKAGDTTTKIFDVIENSKIVESFSFAAGNGEVDTLVDVINKSSFVLDAAKVADGDGRLATVSQLAMTGGANPTSPVVSDYSSALLAIEPYRFNVLIVDTNDTDVHATVQSFVNRVKDDGALNMAVVGEPTSVDFETRLSHAKTFNAENMVFVGGSYVDTSGATVEGYAAAAVVAAEIATTPSSASIVHSPIEDAVETKEKITNSQHEKAIRSGCIMFSESADGTVWIESGINTLVTPAADQDDGWKKIKRVKVRQELIDRIQRTLEPIIGRINCDNDGIANVITLGKQVIDAMVSEGKLFSGDMYEDTANPFYGDSAWFIIAADDIDALEKIYLTYQFRFASNS